MRDKILFIVLLLIVQNCFSESPLYYLCGPDEDGCPEGNEQYCACIPVSANAAQPYCYPADWKSCVLFKEGSDCDLKFDNQAMCVASLFQSEPEPACQLVSQSFCKAHSVPICDESGNLDSCKNFSRRSRVHHSFHK